MKLDIIPIAFGIDNIQIDIVRVTLGESALVQVLFHKGAEQLMVKYIALEGEDYLSWTTDQYIIDKIMSELSLEILETE